MYHYIEFVYILLNLYFNISQIIDYWLLFFLITTSLNIAVHIVIDHFHRSEKALLEKVVEKWKEHVRQVDFKLECNFI